MLIKNNKVSISQCLLYLTILSAFTGTLVMSVEVGPIHLFPYRYMLIFMWFLFIGAIIINNGRLNLSHIKEKIYLQFLLLWIAYAFLSLIWAADKVDALRNIIYLFTGVSIVIFIVHYFLDLNDLKWLYWIWLLIFIILIFVGLWEVTTGNHLSISGRFGDDYIRTKFAPTATFHNQNDFAFYIALSLPMVLVWIRYYPKLYSRALGILIYISGLFILIMTFSRACYSGVLAGLVFWFIFILKLKKKIKVLALMVLICATFFIFFPAEILNILKTVTNRLTSLSQLIGASEIEDDSLNIRLNLVKNVLYFTANTIGFGVGAGNVEYYIANHNIYPVSEVSNVHNWWMEILANYGVFIFAGYLILYFSLILNLWRIYKKTSKSTEKMICESLLVGWVSFFIASCAPSSIIAFEPQWIYLGFVLAFLNYSRTTATVRNSKCIS